ncbi:MAG: transglycosylase domain-containing protein, partial [Shinella sp.]
MALWRKFLIGSLGGAAIIAALAFGLDYADKAYPPPIAVATTVSKEVLDRDGRLLRAFATPDGLWRLKTTATDVDPQFLRMLVAYEDRRFQEHAGIDPLALLRAAGQFVT